MRPVDHTDAAHAHHEHWPWHKKHNFDIMDLEHCDPPGWKPKPWVAGKGGRGGKRRRITRSCSVNSCRGWGSSTCPSSKLGNGVSCLDMFGEKPNSARQAVAALLRRFLELRCPYSKPFLRSTRSIRGWNRLNCWEPILHVVMLTIASVSNPRMSLLVVLLFDTVARPIRSTTTTVAIRVFCWTTLTSCRSTAA